MSDLSPHPTAHYSFLENGPPYSSGVIAQSGAQIDVVRLRVAMATNEALDFAETFLNRHDEPLQALCSLEYRMPTALSFEEFQEYNEGYRQALRERDLLLDGANPIARTNVVPLRNAPERPGVVGFGFVHKSRQSTASFIVAGGGEVQNGRLGEASIVAPDDLSETGLRRKSATVREEMKDRLERLGVTPEQVHEVNVYSAVTLPYVVIQDILGDFPVAGVSGINRHWSRPPIAQLDFEMDLRAPAVVTYPRN